jgi:hypothetical protein
MHLAIKRLARAATIAAAIVASSGLLAMRQPLFATLGDVAFKLTAGFSEVEEVRRKINRGPRAEIFGYTQPSAYLISPTICNNESSPLPAVVCRKISRMFQCATNE